MRLVATVGLIAATFPRLAHAQDDVSLDEGAGLLAEPGRFGIGLGGGSLTTGVSGKVYLDEHVAAQAVVGWWWGAGFSAGVDLLYERAFFRNETLSLQYDLGAGPALGLFSVGTAASVLSIAGVAGASLHLAEVPLELQLELRPTVVLGDAFWSGFYFGGGGAIRYYF